MVGRSIGDLDCDLSFAELDVLRGSAGDSAAHAEGERFHKVHDAFRSLDSRGRPVVSTQECLGVVYILQHPRCCCLYSHFFSWSLQQCVDFLLDPKAALVPTEFRGSQQVRQHMGRWDQHRPHGIDQQQLPVLTIRYEDMLANGLATLLSVGRFLAFLQTR